MFIARFDKIHFTNPAPVRRAALSVGLALALSSLPGMGGSFARATPVETPVCRVHLEKVDVTLVQAQERLETAVAEGLKAECAAMHGQVRALLEVRNIYRRCFEEPQRAETVDRMNISIEETTDRISARCTPRSADAGEARIN